MKNLLSVILLFLPSLIWAQTESLRIGDVRNSWYTQPASFDSVVFEIKPKGLYAEVGMYINFSTRGTNYYAGDSLEVQMDFTLPQNAEVTDMWLWVDKTIVHAGMYDRWTADRIYQGIVKRRQDPAILYRQGTYDYYTGTYTYNNFYYFRIFPLMTNLPRKAKITYLIPINDLQSQFPNFLLPLNILKLSNTQPLSVLLKYFPTDNLGTPAILENQNIPFTSVNSPTEGLYYKTQLQNISSFSSLSIKLDKGAPGNSYLGTYNDLVHGEKFYQLQVTPNELFNLHQNKKALILFDFLSSNSTLSGAQVLNNFKTDLLNKFNKNDSINLMFSGIVTNNYSAHWVSADSAHISDIFNTISSANFKSFSNLPTLLTDGVNFIKDNGNSGTIILISSSGSNGGLNEANSIIGDFLTLKDTSVIPVQIIDLNDRNTNYYYIGNQTYYGNQYLYTILSAQTGGEYHRLAEENYSAMLQNVSERLSGYFSNFDLYVTLESGFTYSNYSIKKNTTLSWFDQPISRVGKFTGSGRFKLIASAQLPSGAFYYNESFVDSNGIHPLDFSTRSIWAGQHIREMHSYTQTNSVVWQIINTSMNERVLSNYTAFLALEPGTGPLSSPQNGNGGTSSVGISTVTEESSVTLNNYPNPFSWNTEIKYSLVKSANVVIEIYDMLGRKISVLRNQEDEAGEHIINFDGSSLAEGTYLCRMVIDGKESLTHKIVVAR